MQKDSFQTSRPQPEVAEKVSLDLRLALAPMPTEVNATNLELKAAEAAMKAARTLNERYRTSCVEVLRKTVTNARDQGEDVEVRYDQRIWKAPGQFIDEFYPLYHQYRQEQ